MNGRLSERRVAARALPASALPALALLASALLLASLGLAPGRAGAQWRQVNGPDRPVVFALAQVGQVLVLGSNETDSGDVFRSTDGGQLWTNAGLPSGGVNVFLAHASGLYAGTYFTGLHRSTDQGAHWSQITSGLSAGEVITGLASPGDPSLFTVTQGLSRVYRSTDNGNTWSPLAASPQKSWTALAAFGSTVLAGALSDGLYRSTNGGASWQAVGAGLPAGATVGSLLVEQGFVYAGAGVVGQPSTVGVYRSVDGGFSWNKISLDLPAQNGSNLPLLAANGGALYAGLEASVSTRGLYRSLDGGIHWTHISATLEGNPTVRALIFQGDDLLAGTDSGLFRSSDGGGSWLDSGFGTAAIRGTGSLLWDGSALHLGLETNGDLGKGIWRTTNAGVEWSGPAGGIPQSATARALARAGTDLLAGVYGAARGIYRSLDAGANWTLSNQGISINTILNAIHEHAGVCLAGAWESLYRSTDGGHTWGTVPGLPEVYAFVSAGPDLYAGLYGAGVRRSTDGGQSWVDVSEGLVSSNERHINDLALHQGTLYAATNGSGVYKRVGGQWVPSGLGTDFIMELLDTGPALVAAGALTGIFFTTDGGNAWTPFAEGYHGEEVEVLASDGIRLFAGSRGHALWTRALSDLPLPAAAGDSPPERLAWFHEVRPNPLRSRALISFTLDSPAEVSLEVFTPEGKRVLRLDQGVRGPGAHEVTFDRSGLADGVYYLRLRAGDRAESRSVRILR